MKHIRRTTLLVLGAVVTGVIALTPRSAAEPKSLAFKKEGVQWSKKMQEFYKTLADLLTDVTSDARFRDPANNYRIDNETNKLAALAHDLGKKNMVSLDKDPTIPLVAGLLARETKRAADELKRNNRTYARNIFRAVPGYCIACHTRNATGVGFAKLPFEPTSKSLTPFERGEFYAATRQFDRAQQAFISVIKDQKAASPYNFEWERAVQQSLAIAVRVRQDPAQAEEIVQSVLDSKNAPAFIKQDAKVWKSSIEEWKSELPHRAASEEGLSAEAIRLMAKAREMQKYPMDRTADVLYLRASAAAHDLLQVGPDGSHVDQALLLAGVSYEVLRPLNTDDLQDLYYEACIRRSPHTEIAGACYLRYEQSILFGYTGSGGTHVPEDVRAKLAELRALSQPADPSLR